MKVEAVAPNTRDALRLRPFGQRPHDAVGVVALDEHIVKGSGGDGERVRVIHDSNRPGYTAVGRWCLLSLAFFADSRIETLIMSLFGHVELHSKNPKAAREFYSGVFGWTYDEVPMNGGVYVMVKNAEGQQVGGIVKKRDKAAPEAWVGYIPVKSVKRTIAKAKRRRAKIVVDYTKVPDMGAYAVLRDPRGGYFGIWEQAAAPKKKAAKKKATKKKATKKKATKKKATKRKATKRKATKRR